MKRGKGYRLFHMPRGSKYKKRKWMPCTPKCTKDESVLCSMLKALRSMRGPNIYRMQGAFDGMGRVDDGLWICVREVRDVRRKGCLGIGSLAVSEVQTHQSRRIGSLREVLIYAAKAAGIESCEPRSWGVRYRIGSGVIDQCIPSVFVCANIRWKSSIVALRICTIDRFTPNRSLYFLTW